MIKFSTLHFSIALLFTGLAVCSSSYGTTVGLTANTGDSYAVWDSFPSASFTGDSPDTSTGLTSPLLDLVSSGFLTGSGDRIYDFGGVTTWTITGSNTSEITTFQLQIKNYQYTTVSLLDISSPTLNGLAFDSASAVYATEGTNTQEIVTWTWEASLLGSSTDTFEVVFEEAGEHISIDALVVNVNSVPEPSSMALLAVGALALAKSRRRR